MPVEDLVENLEGSSVNACKTTKPQKHEARHDSRCIAFELPLLGSNRTL
jgi:hypothetical protein